MISNSAILAERDGVFYEGSDNQLWVINPGPVISEAKFFPLLSPPPNSDVILTTMYFREDSYDSTTRVRRGRFYGLDATGRFPEWPHNSVNPWPRPPLPMALQGLVQMHSVYRRVKIDISRIMLLKDTTVVSLGTAGYESDWRVIDVELTANGELFFTIKSIFPSGVLPPLKTKDVETAAAYENVVDAALKYSPVSVVDVCRESSCVILRKHLNASGDLDSLIKKIPRENIMMISAATIIKRLHPRGKSSELLKQAKNGTPLRPIVDDDAALSVRLFGLLMMECGIAST